MRKNLSRLLKATLCFLLASADAQHNEEKIYVNGGLGLVLILEPRGCDARGVCRMILPALPLSAKSSCAIFQSSSPAKVDRSAWNCLFSSLLERLSPDSKGEELVTACVKDLELAFNASETLKRRSSADKLKFIERMAKTIVLQLVPSSHALHIFPDKTAVIVKAERNAEGTDNYHVLINPAFDLETIKRFLAPAALELVAEISREMWPARSFGAAA